MAAVKVTDSIYSVGILNPNMRVFDIVMSTDYGTTYNSYVLKGEKNVLIEACHKTYFEQYLANIREVIDPKNIDYIVLNHNEPDHSGALAQLLDYATNATVVVSKAGSIYLKNITNRADLKVQVALDGDVIDIGGKTLRFINAPFLHWPDSMFTWVEEEKTLFSCDFLGAHYCEPYTFDYNMAYPAKYEIAFKGYYDAIFGPFKPYVLAGLEKIKNLPIERVCNSHGPIITKGCRLAYVLEKYNEWSQPQKNARLTVPVFYTSAYGNTRKVAKKVAEGILSVMDADVELYDIIDHDLCKLSELLNECDGFAIGTPTINRDAVPPVWQLLSCFDAIGSAKRPCVVFGSYGWSGEGVPNVCARLTSLKCALAAEGLKVNFVPTDEDLDKAFALGEALGKAIG